MSNDVPDDPLPLPLPLDGWHRARGARMVPFAGYKMPIQYEGIVAEHLWTRERAGLFDVSHMGQLLIAGAGADVALETVLPGDIVGLKRDRVRYSMLLAPDGGIVDDLMVTRRANDLYVVVNGATKHGDIDYLRAALPPEVAIALLNDRALLALQGPKAADVLARIAPGVAALGFMTASAFDLAGVPAWISRSGYTGEDGFEISVPTRHAAQVADLLSAEVEVKPIGLGARDSLRLEAGLPLYGHDLDLRSDPASAGLAFAIQKRRREEGGFPGAGRILDLLANGPPTARAGLRLDGRLPAREGAAIYDGDTLVGRVTSGGFAPSLGAPIAMGYVASDRVAAGTALQIDVRGKRLDAQVVPMPFVPHRYHRQGSKP